jgi:hypothetical protein
VAEEKQKAKSPWLYIPYKIKTIQIFCPKRQITQHWRLIPSGNSRSLLLDYLTMAQLFRQ